MLLESTAPEGESAVGASKTEVSTVVEASAVVVGTSTAVVDTSPVDEVGAITAEGLLIDPVVESTATGAIRIGADVATLVLVADPSVLKQANDIFVTAVPVDLALDKSQVCLTNGQHTLLPTVTISPETVTSVPRLIAAPTGEPVPVASTS